MKTKKCEMIESGIAYTMHPIKSASLPYNYRQIEGATFCESAECPYKKQGIRTTYTDSKSGMIYYCKADGVVPKNIKPMNKEFREAENSEYALDL